MAAIDAQFLRDVDHGGSPQQPGRIAESLAGFISEAQSTMHLAIYDFRLGDHLAAPVVEALTAVAQRGVEVRIAYDHGGKPARQPSGHEIENTLAFAARGGDPAPRGTHEWLHAAFDGTRVQLQPIDPGRQIMHDKYVVRDGATTNATVWTGSTNFTDDAWTHQENNIITVASPQVAAGYERDFTELWTTANITGTGVGDQGSARVDNQTVSWDFAPGDGPTIDATIAGLVSSATSTVTVASMVLTSHHILGALADALDRGVTLTGIYDNGQMGPIVKQWHDSARGQATAALFEQVAAHLVSKTSEPYHADSLHNFMHHKVLVCDSTVTTGSFNLSHNATRNAENTITSTSPALADTYGHAINDLINQYRNH